jgi:Tfp pilus assembly protein PilN
MALRLNLYHEVNKAKALKRRDPLKISIYGLSALGACFALYYFAQLVRMHSINDQYLKVKAEFDQLEPKSKAAKKREDELTKETSTSAAMVKRIEGRFYWAPLLSELAQVVPRDVQITRMGGEVTGEGMRRCALTLDGLAAGTDPRRAAEDLRTAIAERLASRYKNVTSTFKSLEDGTETVALDGKQVNTATFAILVQLSFGDEKPAAGAAGRKKK